MIVAIRVLPEYQRKRIGKALLLTVEEKARRLNKKKLLVSTSNDNLPALAFYQLSGYQIYEVIPNAIAEKHGEMHPGLFGIPVRDEIRLKKHLN
ncbi:MAG: GNAT family N-acetyltransferase [archaeon GB-1867-035]|nr:GNAT family N-acetyltransferase [Candidatus Culexmicrobium profundum]